MNNIEAAMRGISLQEQNDRLSAEVSRLTTELAKSELQRATYQSAWQEVKAELDRLRTQEPVAQYEGNCVVAIIGAGRIKAGDKLYASPVPAAQAVPDGWQLVPKEPTPEMVEASFGLAGITAPDANGQRGYIAIAYHAMLAAAPQPPSAPEVGDWRDMIAAQVERKSDDGSALLYAAEAIAAEKGAK